MAQEARTCARTIRVALCIIRWLRSGLSAADAMRFAPANVLRSHAQVRGDDDQ